MKPVMPPFPACPADKHNPQARALREGLRGSVTCSRRSVSESVEALLCPVSCAGLHRNYSFQSPPPTKF